MWDFPVLDVCIDGQGLPVAPDLSHPSMHWQSLYIRDVAEGMWMGLMFYLPTQFLLFRFYFCMLNKAYPNHQGSCGKSPDLLPSTYIKLAWEEMKACVFQNTPGWFWHLVPVESLSVGFAWVTSISLSSSATTWISGAFELCRKCTALVLSTCCHPGLTVSLPQVPVVSVRGI